MVRKIGIPGRLGHLDTKSQSPTYLRDISTAAREVYIKFAEKKGAAVWGCKSPAFFYALAGLGRTFPNARFILKKFKK